MTNYNYIDNYKKDCHKGNTLLYTEPNGGSLYIGGWNAGASFDWNTHVIDLTGQEHKWWDIPLAFDERSKDFLQFCGQNYAGWLSLPFPDFKTPPSLVTYEQWEGIANVIRSILKEKKDVLVACHGGHGRSGLFCAIVGYILAVDTDRSWSSPVEKVRKMHCFDAVETYAQEKFVYDILGLGIQITRKYATTTTGSKTASNGTPLAASFEPCPICGTKSAAVEYMGLCLGCQTKFADAPLRHDMTAADLQYKGEIDHSCDRKDCIGIWKAELCNHIVHDKVIYEGLCEYCWEKKYKEQQFAEAKVADEENTQSDFDPCVICEKKSWYADRFGVCYECAQEIATNGSVDYVHNTITDPYRALPHHCDDDHVCVGIVVADVCGHVVHNREVEDGRCPECIKATEAR